MANVSFLFGCMVNITLKIAAILSSNRTKSDVEIIESREDHKITDSNCQIQHV